MSPTSEPAPGPERTALDEHRERNADAGARRAIRDRIEESGVEFVYYQAVSLTGRVVGKVVPARHLARNLERGVNLHRTAMSDLQSDRSGALLGGGAEAPEFTAMPDLDTFAVLPWDTTVARFLCQVYEPAHRPGAGGRPLATDVRSHLKRAHAAFTRDTGLELRSGCEPEMTWTGPGLEVGFKPGSSPAYHADALEKMRPIYQRVIRYAQALGLDMIEGDYEDPGQLELNWAFDDADRTADRLVTYRQICRQVARELGVTASFMPKPTVGAMGNGCHHNLSLWRGGENVLADPGVRELHLTETGRHALGGILSHSAGSMAVMGSTVNSYKRYWDAGQFAPSQINWGMDNKTCTVRLSANGRLECKLPDAMVNPYLSHAVLLAAIKDGLEHGTDPGEPQEGSSYEGPPSPFRPLPLTLREALDAFAADKVVRSALPEEMADLYLELKSDEWARFCGAVTDWERDMYTEAIP
ncbi:glutamine synthetase family protein [Actinomadura xylanilytica]|uniref:glutamine synthetase family protein n=1 Tax=Actinomadura xylanilytica TaxID=887459 RepID=UPI00255A7B58|nr:glutamine synthetase family protein [Actinomadura xylanilytica]MDL4776510.1 glutamine synthetase family protein [Actinomadura xylanilytica]